MRFNNILKKSVNGEKAYPKILILILYTGHKGYAGYKKILESTYLSDAPDNFSYVFYQGGAETKLDLTNNMLYLNCGDGFGSVGEKTIMAFESALDFDFDFDYVLRCSCSSYFELSKLNDHVMNKDRQRFCSAAKNYHRRNVYPSGCGYIISRDLIEEIVSTDRIRNLFLGGGWDDVSLGEALIELGVSIEGLPRYDFSDTKSKHFTEDKEFHAAVKSGVFHYRCKKWRKKMDNQRCYEVIERLHCKINEDLPTFIALSELQRARYNTHIMRRKSLIAKKNKAKVLRNKRKASMKKRKERRALVQKRKGRS